jgi:phage terminase small subunit
MCAGRFAFMGLTNRQRLFVEHYLRTWNASEASRLAGYKNAPNRQGERLTRNPEIKAAIQARMKETQLKTDDVLTRLAEQATANYAEFFNFETEPDGSITLLGVNWEVFKARGHLVKKLSFTRSGAPILEFHDAQTALIHIGKALGILKETVEQNTHTDVVEVHLYIPDNGRGDV